MIKKILRLFSNKNKNKNQNSYVNANAKHDFHSDRDIFTSKKFELNAKKRLYDNAFLEIDTSTVFFINLDENQKYNTYIQDNIKTIKDAFENKKRIFHHNIDTSTLEVSTLKYFFPFLLPHEQTNISGIINDKALIEFVAYEGNIKTGFLSFHSQGLSFVGIKPNESITQFVTDYLKFLTIDKGNTIFYSIGKDESNEPNIELDEETKLILNKIELHLETLKQSGQFSAIAPKVEQLVKKYIGLEGNQIESRISTLHIDKEFRIFLPDYNNIEIKLAHLTKAIYILFLKHPNGIHLTNLKAHKQELFTIYKNISYKISLDKMEASIDDLFAKENAVFVHLSRIKSAFIKQFTDTYAKSYYIQGEKGKEKYIPIAKEQNNTTHRITFEAKI